MWYEPIRLGKGDYNIVSKSIVGNIVTAYYNSQYGIQCETVHRWMFWSSSAVHVNKMYIFLVWTDRISCPSLANIVTLAYHQRLKFACRYDIHVLRQITLTAAVTVKSVLHYDNVQVQVKDVYKSIFNKKNVILLLPLDDPILTDLGTERVWPGLRL